MRISDWSSDVCSSYLIVLTNRILIGEALEVALDGRDDIPDLLLIADKTLSQRWNLFPAVIERVFSLDMEWIEFDPHPLEVAGRWRRRQWTELWHGRFAHGPPRSARARRPLLARRPARDAGGLR